MILKHINFVHSSLSRLKLNY